MSKIKKNFFKNIIFTKTPLTGMFRYKDKFQIYPIDLPNAPQSSVATHYPVILEFYTIDSEDQKVDLGDDESVNKLFSKATNQTNKIREITNLLSTLTNHRFFFYNYPEQLWTMPKPEKVTSAINNVSSSWNFACYNYPSIGTDLKITNFSTLNIPKIKVAPHSQYYLDDPFDSPLKQISFPRTIDCLLDAFYQLKGRDKKVVNSAIYLLCNSLDIKDRMKSLALISAVSSIETLVNHEYRKEKLEFECNSCKTLKASNYPCIDCGRPIWGIAAKFRKFLKTYVSKTENSVKKYKKIYNLRSKIAHTEYLLTGDSFIDWTENDKTEELLMLRIEAIQLSRLSLVNWILYKK